MNDQPTTQPITQPMGQVQSATAQSNPFVNMMKTVQSAPNSDYSNAVLNKIRDGSFNDLAKQYGYDLTPFNVKTPTPVSPAPQNNYQPTFLEKVGAGLGESILGTIAGTARLGQKIGGALSGAVGLGSEVKLPGLSNLEQAAMPKSATESITKTLGDVAQFFLPGALEAKATRGLDSIIDTAKFGEQFGPKAADVLSKILKVVGTGAITGVSTGGVEALQSGGNVGKTEGAAIAGFAGGAIGKTLQILAPGIINSLAKSDFKLTPQQEVRLGPKIQNAANFIQQNDISGTATTKYKNILDINNKLEGVLQNSASANVTIPTTELESELNNLLQTPEIKADKAVYQSVVNDVKDALNTLKNTEGNSISLSNLLEGKRSYGQSAFGKASAQIKGTLVHSEGDLAVEQAYESALSKGIQNSNIGGEMGGGKIEIPENLQSLFGGQTAVNLKQFDKVYSDAINAKKLMYAAQFKKDTGLVGRIFGLWAGSAVGQAVVPGLPGKIIGGALGEIASTRVPSLIRAGIETGVKQGSTIPVITKGAIGAIGSNTPNQ